MLPQLYFRRLGRWRTHIRWVLECSRYRRARKVIAVSRWTADHLARILSIPAKRIAVAYNGVELDRFSPQAEPGEREELREALGIVAPYFLYIGTGDPRKNLPWLLSVYAEAGVEPPLVLAGKIFPSQRPPIEKALDDLRIRDRVRLLGHVLDSMLPKLYRQSVGLLFPSLAEGFGLPVLEAMACGTPVVALAAGAIPEVAGDAAWLVPMGDRDKFVAAIQCLATCSEKRKELRETGIRQAAKFTWEATAEAVLTVYREILGL